MVRFKDLTIHKCTPDESSNTDIKSAQCKQGTQKVKTLLLKTLSDFTKEEVYLPWVKKFPEDSLSVFNIRLFQQSGH